MFVPALMGLLGVGLIVALVAIVIVNVLPSRWPGGPGLSPKQRASLTRSLGLVVILILTATLGLVLPLIFD